MVQVRDAGKQDKDVDDIAEKAIDLARRVSLLIQGGDASIAAGVMLFLGERYLHAMVSAETEDQKKQINDQVSLVMKILAVAVVPIATKVPPR